MLSVLVSVSLATQEQTAEKEASINLPVNTNFLHCLGDHGNNHPRLFEP